MARSATPRLALIGLLSLGSGAACTQKLELPGGVSAATGGAGAGSVGSGGGAGGGGRTVGGRGGSNGQGGNVGVEPIDATTPPSDGGDAAAPRDAASSQCRHLDGWRQMLPQVIIALDRSSSMWKKPDASSSTRLQNTQRTLRDLMANSRYRSTVRFGYVEFPVKECRTGTCCASSVTPPNSSSLPVIDRIWSCTNQPPSCGETTDDSPVAQALKNVRTSLEMQAPPPGSRHVLLLTDGEPSCAANTEKNDCTLAVNEVNTLSSALKTSMRVIGLTAELEHSQCLDDLATLGAPPSPAGTMPSSTGHTIATDGDKLWDQVNNWLIPLSKEACSFRLPSVKESPTVMVFNDGSNVPQDPNRKDGWEFDVPAQPTRIIFYGSACEKVRNHGDDELAFLLCER